MESFIILSTELTKWRCF